ncbi:diguanylate phosphodiesterase [Photobacterium gaetbulicola]|uniref:Diguanylate phosphodiesterase n=1 Tax=Photobacterium gaetbulicola TaxID=1295392 RepID=A0A0B9FZT9_9GAMM|nr:EAL domain-containing protein [Photobacterium gaetbulicola]KHT61809.1 diguanylate phosphodiesterase [Photobacterium gaetbulicola]
MRLIALLFLFSWLPLKASAYDTLVVHSYHKGMRWTDGIQAGLESVASAQGVSLHVNYMDSKRYQSPAYLKELLDIYRTKLLREEYRAIVVTDDNALWLINQLSNEVDKTPVILAGINDYHPDKHSRLKNVIGILDQTDAAANINLALSVQPDLQTMYVLADKTVTGRVLWKGISDFLADNFLNLEVVRVQEGSFDSVLAASEALPARSAILFLSYFQDSRGNYMDSGDFLDRLTARASAPVYASYKYMLEHGVTGGVMIGGYDKGRQIGAMLVKLLDGKITRFPTFIRSNGKEVFDFSEVVRWGLEIDNNETLIINQPQSWFHRYQNEIRVLTVALSVMGGVIALLVMMIRRLRKGEQRLQQSRALFEGVFDQSFQFIGIFDRSGMLVSGNLALHELVGRAVVKYDRPLWRWFCWSPEAALKLSRAVAQARSQPVRMEIDIQSQEDGSRMLDIVIKRMPADQSGEVQLLLEARDVTARHQMEEKLREREASYRLLYEQQPVMLLTVDRQSRIQSVNQFAADLLGYSKRDLLGHKIASFYDGDEPVPQCYISSALDSAGHRVWRRQLRYCCADGRTVWIRETIRQAQNRQLLVVGEDISSTRELEEQLAYQACHDYLTDLYNRNHFEQSLEKALAESRERQAQHAMLYIDLDQFKIINDTAGHEAGDEALKQVALMLQEITPARAVLARLGGDEFAVILTDCQLAEAVAFGREILQLLEASEFYWQTARFSFSASIGLRMIDETAGSTQQVHAQADTACYAAKDEGRNRLHVYHPDDEELRRRELEMECVSLLRRALSEQRLELYAQPIAPLCSSSQGHHYEILVRIRNDDGEMISPGLFMPAAERYNLAHRIDRYVVCAVIDWLEANPGAVDALDMCAVNLSGQSIGDRDFVHFLQDKIRHSSIPAHKLCLEITETAAIGNMSEAIRSFTLLKELGCRISLDDFGSGLSSFGYLKRMPVDIIKIDGMFVRDIADDEVDFAMVKAINELAKKMGKQTVAEFVENEAILAKLGELGVDYAQGYLFGRPQPLPQLVAQLSPSEEVV